MAIAMTKPWQALTPENARKLTGQLGVYQLGNDEGHVIEIGFAGGRSLFGLRGVLIALADRPPDGAVQFRCEVNMQYLTRYRELLMLHVAKYGALPAGNAANPPPNLGRLSPF